MGCRQLQFWLDHDHGISRSKKSISNHVRELKNEGYVCGDQEFYFNCSMEDMDFRILADSMLFDKQIPGKNANSIINRLIPLVNPRRGSYLLNVDYLTGINRNENSALYKVLDNIDDAIRQNKRIFVTPCYYDIDGNLNPGKEYEFDPFYAVIDKCRYYLLGGCEKHGVEFEPRRIDRIADVRVSNEDRRPIEHFWHDSIPFDLRRYLLEHVYMFSGKAINVRLAIRQNRIGDFIDWFGKGYTVLKRSDKWDGIAEISVRANENAVFYWALQYNEIATILSPDDLMRKLIANLEAALKKYMGLLQAHM